MKLLHQFRRQERQKPTAYSLLDVGRNTVKAAVILMIPDNDEPQLVGYGRAETGNHDVTGGRLEAGAVTRPVNEALTQAEDNAEKYIGQKLVPDDVIFALAGRASVGKLFTVNQNRPKPKEPISPKELNTLRVRAENLVRQKLSDDFFEGGQWQPLAVTDAGLRLDDHLVLEGVGLTGRALSLSVFGMAGQAGALRALEVLSHRLDLAIANVVASPQALASAVPYAEAIILDIGLSGTDVCLIRDDALIGADWIPFGGYFFTQTLARSMDISFSAAEELKQSLSNNTKPHDEQINLNPHFNEPRTRWYDAVMEILTELSPQKPLPKRIYLTGGGSLLAGLDRLLKKNPGPFVAAPEVLPLGRHMPTVIKDLTDSLDYNLFALTLSLTVGLPE